MRQTGIEIIGAVPWGTHFCQFYQDETDLVDILVPYFKAGLEQNEFCMWITSQPLHAAQARAALVRAVPHLDEYLAKGQIEILEYDQWYTQDGQFDSDRVLRAWVEKLNSAQEKGFAGLRLSGNTFWLEKADWQSFTDYEQAVDSVIGQYRMLAICTYCLARCGAAEVLDVMANHAFALIKRAGDWTIIENSDRRKTEASLRESAEAIRRQAALIDLTPDAIFVRDPDSTITFWSRGAEQLYGWSKAEAAGRSSHDLLQTRFPEPLQTIRQTVVQTGRWSGELVHLTKSGSEIVVESRWLAQYDERGRLREILESNVDITERRRSEEELRQRVEELRKVMEVAPVAIWVARDPQCNDIVGNAAGDQLYEATGGENVSANQSAVRRFFESGKELSAGELPMQRSVTLNADVRDSELEVLLPSGGRITMIGNAIPLRDSEGQVRGSVGAFLNITARKQAEEELRRSREWLSVTLSSIGDAVLATGTDGRITFMNPVAEKLTGWDSAEALGKPVQEIFRVINEQTREPGDDIVGRVLSERRVVALANHSALLTRDGREIPIEDSAAPILDGGQVAGAVLVFHDVTEKRRSQQALRESERRLRYHASVLEARNRILREALSCQTEEELGRSCLAVAEELTGSKFGFIGEMNARGLLDDLAISDPGWEACRMQTSGERRAPLGFKIHGIYGRIIKDGKSLIANDPASHPDRIGTPPGHPPLTAFLGVPLQQEGKTIGMIAVGNRPGGYRAQDQQALEDLAPIIVQVFLRKRAELAVRAAEERLRQAQKLESIGLLAGGIAHDFNNLLVGIVGNASLAEDMLPAESPVVEILHSILQAGEQAAHLTRQMLAYAGKGIFLVEPINLSALVSEASSLVRASVPKKINVSLHLESSLPTIEADPSQMQQVFMNLFLNAAEAIGNAPGVISVSTGEIALDSGFIRRHLADWPVEPGHFVFLDVHDNGCGMDPATQTKIFDPFFTTKFQGRGLGLAAVAGIVRAHHGAIQLRTEKGIGTTFRVLFPAMPKGGAAEEPREQARERATVLVVDDEAVVRDVARRALERQGWRVLLAESGMDAIELARTHGQRIKLMILDLGMPGMSGEEVLPEIRKLTPEIPVLVSSGFSEAETLRAFDGCRVAGFIQKPYTVHQLTKQVKVFMPA